MKRKRTVRRQAKKDPTKPRTQQDEAREFSLDSGVAQQRPSKTSLAQHPRSKHGGLCSLHLHLPATATGKTVLRTEGKEAEARVVARVLAILRACTGNLGTKRPSRGGVVSQGNGRGGGCRGTRVRDRVYNLPPVTLTYPRGGDPQPLKSLLDLSDSLIQAGLLAHARYPRRRRAPGLET